MSVYVGVLFPTCPTQQWRYRQAAHLYADSDDELVAFATRIGLLPTWLQAPGTYKAHFDLTKAKRAAAVAAGAIEQSQREEVRRLQARRKEVVE